MNVEILEYQMPDDEQFTDEEMNEMESWIIDNAPSEEGTWICTHFGFSIMYRTTLS